ncbi:hypothetical protein [Chitinophaga barathri]|uniref:Uncharacterized protein n=1 Tax=Chitinophaga barathri TaxID=1647451 RepID=A0A3N4MDR1_9BACT|nr:hypothetical protein [Chitinophaga barathri]RPD42014.1 hypothetical protein EG028_07630 [Chitinophaga barathri]
MKIHSSLLRKSRYFLPAAIFLALCLLIQCKKSEQPADVPAFDAEKAKEHIISGRQANAFTTELRTSLARLEANNARLANKTLYLTPSVLFSRETLAGLLRQPGVTGVRIYAGRLNNGKTTLLAVATNNRGQDIPSLIVSPEKTLDITEASALVHSFRTSIESVNPLNLPRSELFNRDAIAVLLNKKQAASVRIYWGSENGAACMILVPVNAAGNDIHTRLLARDGEEGGDDPGDEKEPGDDDEAIERGHRCPHSCDVGGPIDDGNP